MLYAVASGRGSGRLRGRGHGAIVLRGRLQSRRARGRPSTQSPASEVFYAVVFNLGGRGAVRLRSKVFYADAIFDKFWLSNL